MILTQGRQDNFDANHVSLFDKCFYEQFFQHLSKHERKCLKIFNKRAIHIVNIEIVLFTLCQNLMSTIIIENHD